MDIRVMGYLAIGLNGVTLLAILVLAIIVMILVRTVVKKNFEQISESLPKVINLIEKSEFDICVLIAVCEEKGTTAQELADMFKEDADRKAVVERRFGAKSRLTKRFMEWPGSVFMQKGYPAEEYLKDYM